MGSDNIHSYELAQGHGLRHLERELFPRLGVIRQLRRRAYMVPGDLVGGVVARGEAELGFQQVSELKPLPRITGVGPLPDEVQRVTVHAAGVASGSAHSAEARASIAFLASLDVADLIRTMGLQTMG